MISTRSLLARLACLLTLVTILTAEAYPQAGNSGLAFLKLGVSARGVAMGDAMSAAVTGAPAAYYNPAGLLGPSVDAPPVQLMFTHKEWIQDTRLEFLGGTVRIGDNHALGISVNTTSTSDIQIRTRPGPSQGTFTARDFSAGLSYAYRFSDDLNLGATVKFLYEKIFIDETSGLAFDLGAQFKTPLDDLTVGAMVANLGEMKDLRNDKTTLPALLRIGPAYTIELENAKSRVTVATDLLHVFPEKHSYLNVGGEFLFNHVLAARLGYQFGSEGRGFSGGIGLEYDIFLVDYAYAPVSSDLGNTHTISVAINF